ncbi:hypothetical protein [Streptomyces sp. MBT27]|uniref:hypothetical protein n=1 Tax=Streptomyces sp. MBT27 TaxID=1488356 RepID=UPI00142228C2|nr:hypothetical protein [Streptomyces sp. MBT27]
MPNTVAPDAPTLERPDFAAIRAAAEAETKAELDAITTPDARRAHAADLYQSIIDQLTIVRPERDRLMVSLAIYQRPEDTPSAAGCSRGTLLTAIRTALAVPDGEPTPAAADRAALGKKLGVPHVKNAAAKLPEVAIKHETLVAQRRATLAVLTSPTIERVSLKRQDFAHIKAQAAEETETELLAIKDPAARLREASRIAREAEAAYTVAARERDRCALSLEFYSGGRAVDKAMGVARTAFDELRRIALGLDRKQGRLPDDYAKAAAAEEAGLEWVEDAAERLPAAARKAAAARARHLKAAAIRNETAAALDGKPGWDMQTIAETTGLHVNSIRAKIRAVQNRT